MISYADDTAATEFLRAFDSLPASDRHEVCRAILLREDTLCGRAWALARGAAPILEASRTDAARRFLHRLFIFSQQLRN